MGVSRVIIGKGLSPVHSRASGPVPLSLTRKRGRVGWGWPWVPAFAGTSGSGFEMLARKADQRGIHLIGSLLLDPVAGALEDHLVHAWHDRPELIECALPHRTRDHGVVRSRDEQRRLHDLRVLPGRGQLPVAVDVAIPVEPAAEAGAAILGRKHIEIALAQPWRQCNLARRPEKPLRAIHIKAHFVFAR